VQNLFIVIRRLCCVSASSDIGFPQELSCPPKGRAEIEKARIGIKTRQLSASWLIGEWSQHRHRVKRETGKAKKEGQINETADRAHKKRGWCRIRGFGSVPERYCKVSWRFFWVFFSS
jgi:hypothetical protein